MKLKEIAEAIRPPLRHARPKAGFIPYFINPENNEIEFLFMVSSDPLFGGSDPAIAKGKIDKGESERDAALREAEEELGWKKENLISHSVKPGWVGEMTGLDAHYTMSVFIGEVKSKSNFNSPDDEVSETKWMTLEQFEKDGRKIHRPVVRTCYSKINK